MPVRYSCVLLVATKLQAHFYRRLDTSEHNSLLQYNCIHLTKKAMRSRPLPSSVMMPSSFHHHVFIATVIVALLVKPAAAFCFVAKQSFQATMTPQKVLASRTSRDSSSLSMWTMPEPLKLEDFNAAAGSAPLWYSSVDPKARLPVYDEE